MDTKPPMETLKPFMEWMEDLLKEKFFHNTLQVLAKKWSARSSF